VPAVESGGCSSRPPTAAGAWYKHLDGGFPVQGVRFGGLKSVKFGLCCIVHGISYMAILVQMAHVPLLPPAAGRREVIGDACLSLSRRAAMRHAPRVAVSPAALATAPPPPPPLPLPAAPAPASCFLLLAVAASSEQDPSARR
jgi:hypothetical protein